MKMRLAAVCALLLALGTSVSAHRVDEYLQATTLSLTRDRVQAQIRLSPGVAVFPIVFANMDTNADGVLSPAEEKAYAEQMLGDLSLTMDGQRLRLQLVSWKFAKTEEMKVGLGDIQLDFNATVPHDGPNRSLVFKNHHLSQVGAYLVNCLVPNDPNIQVTSQKRNYQQSSYELDYRLTDIPSSRLSSRGQPGILAWMSTVILLLSAPFALLWRRSRHPRSA